MFTGIIEEVGKIQKITKSSLDIICQKVLENTCVGDSIAVEGVCLTVTDVLENGFRADVSEETLKVTTLGGLQKDTTVNLERAMPMNGRFGGHIVSGHVDGIAKVCSLNKNKEFYHLELKLPDDLQKYVVKKGSITVNGISLTIADIYKNQVKIAIIPHTFDNTSLKDIKSNDVVNIETDILAKYIEKFLSTGDNSSRIDEDFLRKNGFY